MAGPEVQMKLIEAARYGSEGGVRFFIKRVDDIDWPDGEGWTALHWAAAKAALECVELLVAGKATVDVANLEGETALHIAAKLGHVEVQRFLIKAGASLRLANAEGRTPVDLAKARS